MKIAKDSVVMPHVGQTFAFDSCRHCLSAAMADLSGGSGFDRFYKFLSGRKQV